MLSLFGWLLVGGLPLLTGIIGPPLIITILVLTCILLPRTSVWIASPSILAFTVLSRTFVKVGHDSVGGLFKRGALPEVHAELPADGGEVLVEVLHLVGAAPGPLDQPCKELLNSGFRTPLHEDHGKLGSLETVNGRQQTSWSPGGRLILVGELVIFHSSVKVLDDFALAESGLISPLAVKERRWMISPSKTGEYMRLV